MKQQIAKTLLTFSLAVLTSTTVLAKDRNTDYPIQDPLIATITGAANHTNKEFTIIEMEPKPERSRVRLFEDQNIIEAGLLKSSRQGAPMVFVIAGIGGNAMSGTALMLADQLHSMGYTAVTLPNPINYQYALSVSGSGTPGYLPRDANEYYNFMKFVTKKLSRYGVRSQNYSVVGFSYGGLLTGYLMKEDNEQKFFNFEKAVMINPAVDLNHGVETLDAFYQTGFHLTGDQKKFLLGSIVNVGGWLISQELNSNNIMAAVAAVPKVTVKYRKWIVGDSFRNDLANLIFVSQQIKDTGILKKRATEYFQNERYEEAKGMSFYTYITKAVIPVLPAELKSLNPSEAIDTGGLYPLIETLAQDERVYVQTNADDFLLQQGDVEMFRQALGERFFLYNHGGHLGNLWFKQNVQDLRAIMSK